MGVLQRTFANLRDNVVSLAVYSTSSPDATQKAQAAIWVNDGYRMLLSAHDWSFLKRPTTVYLWPTTTTGVITVGGTGNKTLTASTATFYETMIGKTIVGNTTSASYTIDAYTSSTVVTVTADASANTGGTFTITANGDYSLPANFAAQLDDWTFDDDLARGPLHLTAAQDIRYRRSQEASTDDPTHCAIVERAFSTTTGRRHSLMVWPTPSQVRAITALCRIDPTELATDAEYPEGGPEHAIALQYACLAATEGFKPGGYYTNLYETVHLPRAIARDGQNQPHNLGYNADHSDDATPPAGPPNQGTWTYA